MEELIIGVLLLILGVAIVFFVNKPKAESTSVADTTTAEKKTEKKELTEEEKQAAAEARLAKRKEVLKNLRVPGSLKDIVFYFGSQTGTAEKFCV